MRACRNVNRRCAAPPRSQRCRPSARSCPAAIRNLPARSASEGCPSLCRSSSCTEIADLGRHAPENAPGRNGSRPRVTPASSILRQRHSLGLLFSPLVPLAAANLADGLQSSYRERGSGDGRRRTFPASPSPAELLELARGFFGG